MKRRNILVVLGLLLLAGAWPLFAQENPGPNRLLHLTLSQKDFLTLEPILLTVQTKGVHLQPGLEKANVKGEPAVPSLTQAVVRLTIKPAVKLRPNAKPLELESKAHKVQTRLFDLLEWYQFPAQGTFTVMAVVQTGTNPPLVSAPVQFTIGRPDKKAPEWGPVDRLHHMPWSNYVTNAFCGDTFDVVKRWPESRLTRYSHYWNGLHMQQKKDYAQAIASFRTVVEKYPTFELAAFADIGIIECLLAQKKFAEAAAHAKTVRGKLQKEYAWAETGAVEEALRLQEN